MVILKDVKLKLDELADGEPVYEVKCIKQKLEKKIQGNIFLGEILGGRNTVCFKNMENPIINDKWCGEKKTNEEDEVKRIIEMKGKRIKNNIKQFPSSKCLPKFTYPSRKHRKLIEFLITLRFFLSLLIHSEIKVESIGQCLMKADLRESLCHLCCLRSKSTVCLLQSG